jgi:hypothetical protein
MTFSVDFKKIHIPGNGNKPDWPVKGSNIVGNGTTKCPNDPIERHRKRRFTKKTHKK